eukprot:TRINITY_DN1659_c0_g1_i1.p1 TRINITY_DN1659_c0_g1~~TRINITY_DN1659_c0_g1_i1.p1  ORF type:complete len:191 (+),score=24.22 TRINITY_DN1659_c0_g1_i1:92-664(+)
MAYVIETKKLPKSKLLPISGTLKNGRKVVLDYANESDYPTLQGLLNQVIEEGMTYPQWEQLTMDQFKAYFLAADAFTAKDVESSEILGTFYIKPNYPGRCSHICNAGFIVKPSSRSNGLARWMAIQYLKIAKDLGYKGSMFNLVFESNTHSVNLWRSLNFKEIGVVPKAGLLKDGKYHNAIQFYYDFTLE